MKQFLSPFGSLPLKISAVICCALLFLSCSAQQPPGSETQVNQLRSGDRFADYTLEDQFHKKHSLAPDTRRVIISRNMELSKEINAWLSQQGPEFLTKNKIEYVSDISEMPSLVTWMFARPKLQKYQFPILLAQDDDFSTKYSVKVDSIAVYDLSPEHTILALHYVSSVKDMPPLPNG